MFLLLNLYNFDLIYLNWQSLVHICKEFACHTKNKKEIELYQILKCQFSSSHVFSFSLKLFSKDLQVLLLTYMLYGVSHLRTNCKTGTENSNGYGGKLILNYEKNWYNKTLSILALVTMLIKTKLKYSVCNSVLIMNPTVCVLFLCWLIKESWQSWV